MHRAYGCVSNCTYPYKVGLQTRGFAKVFDLYYANLTMWGPKARDWLASSGQEFHGVLLTGAHEADLSKAVRYMRKHG